MKGKEQLDFHVLTHTPSRTTTVHEPQHIYDLLQTTGSECNEALLENHCRDEIPQEQFQLSLSLNFLPSSCLQNWRGLRR